jgi:hypothetical protein
MWSGRIGQLADAIIVHLPSISCLATFQLGCVARRVAGDDELTFAEVPWERVVGMEGGDGITLEDFAMILIAGDECIGGEVDSSDISKNNHTIGSSYPCHCVVLSHVDADIAAA